MDIRLATSADFNAVVDFYYTLIDDIQGTPYAPKWKKDIHPDRDSLEIFIKEKFLYILTENEAILGAVVLNNHSGQGYDKVNWPVKAAPEEVLLIHLLGVSTKAFGRGIGGKLVDFSIELAKSRGLKALRLDVIEGNFPAMRLYEKKGFKYIETARLYYEDTGWHTFDMYEYSI